jgi:phosphatidate phosphatase APP1
MDLRKRLHAGAGRLRRLVYLLGRPARADRGRGGPVIRSFRGYGSRREVFLMGRVFRLQRVSPKIRQGALGRDLVDIARLILRQGVRGAVVKARFANTEQQVETDHYGYFQIDLHPASPPPAHHLWHRVILELPGEKIRTAGAFFVPPSEARFVVISDIDDTVIFTGLANKLKMLWRLFWQGVDSRVAFPGVAAFYRGLHRGVSGAEWNPMLYVSRSPWSLYEMLEEFFHLHDIPAGPILFLREWGITPRRPLPMRAREHKITLIRRMLAVYGDLPVILIGDSGQRDPEIYAQVVREHPGRVLAIYIRHVDHRPGRQLAIETLAQEVGAAGSALLLSADTLAMAEHAAARGYIAQETVTAVLRERSMQQEPGVRPLRRVQRETRGATCKKMLRGGLARGQVVEKGKKSTPSPTGDGVLRH